MKKQIISERAIIGFDHGLSCRVKNMDLDRASVTTKTSAFGLGFCLLSPSGHVFSHGMGDHDQILQYSAKMFGEYF